MAYKNLIIQPSQYSEQHRDQTSQFYKGFSTVDATQTSPKLYDFDIVKQDLVNQFNTRPGERVMNPDYGSVIWTLIYEPLTDNVKQLIEDDVNRIVTSDPRISNPEILLSEAEYGFILEVTLTYTGTSQVEKMRFAFDRNVGLITQ
jgi:phage baseplate assembly protein W